METRELEIKVDSFRKIPNPYKEGPGSASQMYAAMCDVKNVPEELLNWMETNPRKQNIRSGVAGSSSPLRMLRTATMTTL